MCPVWVVWGHLNHQITRFGEESEMEKKLYRVKVVLYVMAENEYDACAAATNAQFDIFECEAERTRSVDPGWEDAVPYNSDSDRTCSQIIKQNNWQMHPAIQPVTQLWN
jgi:hypothetical protein